MKVRDYRCHIGAEILKSMNDNEDLPLPNVFRVVKTMMEYFGTGDYVEQLKEEGSRWQPSELYWHNNLKYIRELLRKENKFFEYIRENGDWKGCWKFVGKKEYDEILRREHADIGTRTDTFNDRLSDGKEKWKLDIPGLKSVPTLPKAS